MALFDPRFPAASADVVAVFNQATGAQVFADARPLKAVVSETAQLMTHPLEDGSNIIDHRIILPIGLSLSMIIEPDNYRATYQEIRQLFRQSTRFIVQTRTDNYSNLYLQSVPHEETPELFDTITIVMEFIEALFTAVQIQALPPDSVRDANDSSTLDRGEVTGTDGGNRGSLLFRGLT